jgi:tetratricopeptide (TPR) repeat protein
MTAMRVVPASMIRSIASAAVLGVVAALGILYAAGPSELRNGIAAGRGTFGTAEAKTTIEARTAIEDWPICSSIGDWAELDPDFAAGKKALAESEWTKAITALEFAAARDPGNADIQNYIGYGYRRLSQLGPAMGHFQQALLLNPRHRGAHEHLGELFLALNEPAQAEEQLAALKQICLIPCEEFGSLQQAIEVGKRFSTR